MRLTVFDVDGVLVPLESSWGWIHSRLGCAEQARMSKLLYEAGVIGYWEWMYLDTLMWIDAWPGITKWDLARIFEEVEVLPEAKRAVEKLRRHGIEVALISGGVDLLVSRVAVELGVSVWEAQRLAFDPWGKLVPGGLSKVEGDRKDKALRRVAARLGVPLRAVAFVGDSRWDLRAFREACIAIAVKPRDECVAREADYVVDNVEEAAELILKLREEARGHG